MKKTIKVNQKGITLITLVITVIVLMILAGVGVAALTGEKSVIKEANDAASSAEQQSAKEKVQAAVLGAVKKDGSIDLDILNNKLGTNIESLPAAVTIDRIKLVISKDGSTSAAIGDKKVIFINDQYYAVEQDVTWEEWIEEGIEINDWIIKINDEGYLAESYTTDNGVTVDICILNSQGSRVKKIDEIKDGEKYTKKVDRWY